MNERIKELSIEAGLYVEVGDGWWPQALTAEECNKAYEKFAELIIRECGSVGDHWVDNEDNGKNLVSDKLKQHFGVEL